MDDFNDFTAGLELDEDCFHRKRETCERCSRPMRVCWCQYLPECRLPITTFVLILQHPYEQSRRIQTAKILELALPEDKIRVVKGRKFNAKRTPDLMPIFLSNHTALLYPCAEAEDLVSYTSHSSEKINTLVVLDGTWPQAKSLYSSNPVLHSLRKVGLLSSKGALRPSEFVIRKQPSTLCLSTVEAVARALTYLEDSVDSSSNNDSLEVVLCRPMLAMCEVQLNCGAVVHDPKETGIAGRRRVVDQELFSDEKSLDNSVT